MKKKKKKQDKNIMSASATQGGHKNKKTKMLRIINVLGEKQGWEWYDRISEF